MIRSIKFLGAIVLVLGLTAYVQADDTKGTIKSVNSEKNEVVLKGIVRDTTYEVNKDTIIMLDGKKATLGDLRADDKANIVYDKKGDHMIASEVRGLRRAQEASGTIKSTFGDKREVTLKGVVKDTTYELNKDATVWLNGKKSNLSDLREGDTVLITYEQKGDHNMAADVRAGRK